MSAILDLAPGARLFVSTEPFALERGGILPELCLTYELTGPEDLPVVLVQGGISSDPHAGPTDDDPRPGWWPGIVGRGTPLDAARFRLLSIEFLGRRDRVVVSSGDQAHATALLLDQLGIRKLHAFVGASYGGMVALRFAAEFPDRVERVIAISAGDRALPFATALRSLQRRILALGRVHGAAREATALARALGLVSYRAPAGLAARFGGGASQAIATSAGCSSIAGSTAAAIVDDSGRGGDDIDPFSAPWSFPVERWLVGKGRSFADRFDPEALARLSLAIDLHEVDVGAIRARTTFVAADPDLLVPPEQLLPLPARCGGPARCLRLASAHGHDAFLKETATLGPWLAEWLAEPVAAGDEVAPIGAAGGGR
jgi:homoserine O-acetyltransferase